jgi:hypothetical protein
MAKKKPKIEECAPGDNTPARREIGEGLRAMVAQLQHQAEAFDLTPEERAYLGRVARRMGIAAIRLLRARR